MVGVIILEQKKGEFFPLLRIISGYLMYVSLLQDTSMADGAFLYFGGAHQLRTSANIIGCPEVMRREYRQNRKCHLDQMLEQYEACGSGILYL